MEPDEYNPLGDEYTQVHVGSMAGSSHTAPTAPAADAATDTSLGGKLDELLYGIRSLTRTVEDIKREVDAIRTQLGHRP